MGMAGHQFNGKIGSDERYGQKTKGKGDLRQHQKGGIAANAHQASVVLARANHGQDSHDEGRRQGHA